jgi:hypothetical protein
VLARETGQRVTDQLRADEKQEHGHAHRVVSSDPASEAVEHLQRPLSKRERQDERSQYSRRRNGTKATPFARPRSDANISTTAMIGTGKIATATTNGRTFPRACPYARWGGPNHAAAVAATSHTSVTPFRLVAPPGIRGDLDPMPTGATTQ